MSKTELAPAPKRRSYPKALKAQIVAKFTDHLPLYRQEGILARAGLQLPRSTLGEWVGVCEPPITETLHRWLIAQRQRACRKAPAPRSPSTTASSAGRR